MTFNSFCSLPYIKKVHLLYKEGVYIGKRKIVGATVTMYQLQDFYVEIIYKKYRKEIAAINATKDMEALTPYLDQIDVKELIAAY